MSALRDHLTNLIRSRGVMRMLRSHLLSSQSTTLHRVSINRTMKAHRTHLSSRHCVISSTNSRLKELITRQLRTISTTQREVKSCQEISCRRSSSSSISISIRVRILGCKLTRRLSHLHRDRAGKILRSLRAVNSKERTGVSTSIISSQILKVLTIYQSRRLQ